LESNEYADDQIRHPTIRSGKQLAEDIANKPGSWKQQQEGDGGRFADGEQQQAI
jgi:hypothetical protein